MAVHSHSYRGKITNELVQKYNFRIIQKKYKQQQTIILCFGHCFIVLPTVSVENMAFARYCIRCACLGLYAEGSMVEAILLQPPSWTLSYNRTVTVPQSLDSLCSPWLS